VAKRKKNHLERKRDDEQIYQNASKLPFETTNLERNQDGLLDPAFAP